jgi:hypothetical protein
MTYAKLDGSWSTGSGAVGSGPLLNSFLIRTLPVTIACVANLTGSDEPHNCQHLVIDSYIIADTTEVF